MNHLHDFAFDFDFAVWFVHQQTVGVPFVGFTLAFDFGIM